MLQNEKVRSSLKDLLPWLLAPLHTQLQKLSYGGFRHKQLQWLFYPTLWSYKSYEKEHVSTSFRDMMLFKSRAEGKSNSLLFASCCAK